MAKLFENIFNEYNKVSFAFFVLNSSAIPKHIQFFLTKHS